MTTMNNAHRDLGSIQSNNNSSSISVDDDLQRTVFSETGADNLVGVFLAHRELSPPLVVRFPTDPE